MVRPQQTNENPAAARQPFAMRFSDKRVSGICLTGGVEDFKTGKFYKKEKREKKKNGRSGKIKNFRTG